MGSPFVEGPSCHEPAVWALAGWKSGVLGKPFPFPSIPDGGSTSLPKPEKTSNPPDKASAPLAIKRKNSRLDTTSSNIHTTPEMFDYVQGNEPKSLCDITYKVPLLQIVV
jgi:hypothetical protein